MSRVVTFCLLFAASLWSSCASPFGNEAADLDEQDPAMAVRIKGALIEQLEMAGTAIDVEFEAGRVVLGGFVETESEREEAATIARQQAGVVEVVNRIVVKE